MNRARKAFMLAQPCAHCGAAAGVWCVARDGHTIQGLHAVRYAEREGLLNRARRALVLDPRATVAVNAGTLIELLASDGGP